MNSTVSANVLAGLVVVTAGAATITDHMEGNTFFALLTAILGYAFGTQTNGHSTPPITANPVIGRRAGDIPPFDDHANIPPDGDDSKVSGPVDAPPGNFR